MMTPPDSIVTGEKRAAASEPPLVTLVVPARQEAKFIASCLDSMLANDYPHSRLEILVVDGMSDDGTRDIVARYAARFPFVRLVDNPRRTTPAALNAGLAAARGEIVLIMGAHALYSQNYVSGLVGWLQRSGADNVGAMCVIRPSNDGALARAIATALSHPFGAGNSYHKIGVSEPRLVDTVAFGCYWRRVFDKIGGFDEDLVRNQDDELNSRLVKQGGRILLVPDVKTEYVARDTLGKLWRMNFQYGYYKPIAAAKVGRLYTWRQTVPGAFVLSVLVAAALAPFFPFARWAAVGLVAAYAAGAGAAALTARGRLGLACRALLPLAFGTIHASYGTGYLLGIAAVCRHGTRPSQNAAAVPLSR